MIETWVELGKQNGWIAQAYDPEFDADSFKECATVDELMDHFEHGNWSLGQAFYYKNLCFIQQVDGGDEWLTIRGNIKFESWSCAGAIRRHDREWFAAEVEKMLAATDEQLRNLEY